MGVKEAWKKEEEFGEAQGYFDVKAAWEQQQASGEQNAGYFNVREQWIHQNTWNIQRNIYDRYSTWHDNSDRFYQAYNNRFRDRKWNYEDSYTADSGQWLSAMSSQREALNKDAAEINYLIETYGSYMPDQDFIKGVSSELRQSVNSYDDIISVAQQDAEYWKSWGEPKTGFDLYDDIAAAIPNYGQAAYTQWQEASRNQAEILNFDIPAAQAEIAELKEKRDAYIAERGSEVASIDYVGDLPADGSTPYDARIAELEQKIANTEYLRKYTSYTDVMRENDYAIGSRYVSTYGAGTETYDWRHGWEGSKFGDLTYDAINKNPDAVEELKVEDYKNDRGLTGDDYGFLQSMTEDEIGIYNYLYATQSPEEAWDYILFLKGDLKARELTQKQQGWAKYAEEHPVLSSIFSVLISPMKVVTYGAQAVDYFTDGAIDPYAGYNDFSRMPSTMRAAVSETVKNGWSGKVGSFFYNTGMSMADFLFSTGITGGNQALTLAIMGAGAAADSTLAAKDRGLSDGKAFAIGTIAGIAEVAMEKISLGAWLDGDLSEGALKYLLKNALSEGFEEVGTDVINLLADVMIAGDKSEWKTAMNKYMAENPKMSEAEAFGLVAADQAMQMGLDFLGGALSGLTIAGGTYAGSSIAANHSYGDIAKNGDYVNALVAEALEIDPENSLALRMQERLQAGKNVSALQVQELVQQNETGMVKNDQAAIQTAAENRLTELGEAGDVSGIAAALAKQAAGDTLAFAERRAIRNSTYGTRVANELNIENIDSGDFSSDWAQRIGTDRINAESYGKLMQELEAEDAASVEIDTSGQIFTPKEAGNDSPNVAVVESVATTPVVEAVPDSDTATPEASSATGKDTDVPASVEAAAKAYGKQASAVIAAYNLEEGKQDAAEFNAAYRAAYDMGMAGVNFAYAKQSNLTEYLTDTQKEWAYNAGRDAAAEAAARLSERNAAKANGKTGRKKGTVKGENVSIADLKKSFNDAQNTAYKALSFYAETTGIDIVLYKSEVDADGNFQGAQGRYKRNEPGTIYIDINAGLENIKSVDDLAKYTMLRTFAHEFTHFIEKWNPVQYNEFRKVIFDTITAHGENVQDLIEAKQSKKGLSYDMASREVVAEAMTDILPDSKFAQELAEHHKSIFQKLLDMLKEFLADVQAAFKGMGDNRSREANALKQQVGDAVHYVENIVEMFDRVAAEAVENYQKTVAVEETAASQDAAEASISDFKTESTVLEAEEATHEVKPAEPYTSEHGYTITDNAADRVTTIQFKEKPSNLVREALKSNAFVWSKTKGAWTRSGKWYGRNKLDAVIAAIDNAYATATIGSKTESVANPASAPTEQTIAEDDVREQSREYLYEQANDVLEQVDKGVALEDIRSEMVGNGIRWNNGSPIKLSKGEYAAVVSRISSSYYDGRGHDGVQIIERSTDGKKASFYAYLYFDHGFGHYEIVGRIDYSKGNNEELISWLRSEIHDRKSEGNADGVARMRRVRKRIDSDWDSNKNGQSNPSVYEQTPAGTRKRGQNNGRSGTEDHDGSDEGSYGGIDSQKQERTSPLTDRDVLELAANEIKVDDLTVQEQSRGYLEDWDSYELSEEFTRMIPRSERSAFLRSLANQTNALSDGGSKNIVILTENTAYFFHATGYMNGSIDKKMKISGRNNDKLIALQKEYINGTDKTGERPDAWSESVRSEYGRGNGNYAYPGNAGTADPVNSMDDLAHESDPFGDFGDYFGYSSYEELIEAIQSGAMVMDDNGKLIEKPQYQERTSPLMGRDVQEQSGGYLDEGYATDSTKWAYDNYIIDEADRARFYEVIADLNKRRYHVPKTPNGAFIIEHGNKIMLSDGDFKAPTLSKVIVIKDYYMINVEKVKGAIIHELEAGNSAGYRETCELYRDLYEDGIVHEYNSRSYKANAREDGRREGSYGGKTGKTIKKRGDPFEQYQERTSPLTDRDVLELAANEIKVDDLTEGEQSALQIFKNRLTKLQELQEQRAEQGRLYRQQQFGPKVDRAEAGKTLNRMKVLDDQIKKAGEAVLDVEKKEVLSRVLKKARKVVELQEREHGQELLSRYRERRSEALSVKKYRERIRKEVDELSKWVLKPDAKNALKHVPDVLKNPVISFITSVDLSSKQKLRGGDVTKADNAFVKRLEKLHGALKANIDLYGIYSGYNDLPTGFMDDLEGFIRTTNTLVRNNSGEFVINQMSSVELRDLYRVIKVMKKFITQVNKFHSNAMFQHVSDAGDSSIEFLEELQQNQTAGAISNFLLWQQMRPAYVFERFGEGGKAIYDELRRGQSKLAFNTREIIEFAESTYTEKEVKAWEKEVKTLNMSWGKAKLTVAQMMGFYELSKQPDSLRHMQENGIRVATYKKGKDKISDVGHTLTAGDFNTILDALTPRQKEVADKLQQYMAKQGAAWGNYVSVARFGEELFSNPQYYPINSDGRHLDATAEEHPNNASLYALLNMGFTKQRNDNANNRIVLYSIFDVFSNHMASMAQYNALALPVLDALKWFNYQQIALDEDGNKHIIGSVREGMDRAYGVPVEDKPGKGKQGYAETFVVNIIKSFNGTKAQGMPYDARGMKQLHAYNRAQVAYNLRVVVQQPLAITRAGLLLDHSAILRGLKASPSTIKKNIAEMQKYSGIAAWKSLGFYDVNISRGVVSLIKHEETMMNKVTEKGMWLAEQADEITWAAIWNACKEQVARKQGLKTTDAGFYEAVTKLFEDVIYKTQVVDSVLTKNEFMRDKGFWSRMVSSFMSEPVTTISMVIDGFHKIKLDIQRGMTMQQAWQKNGKMIARRVYVYAIGALLLAAVQAAADAWRDDDEYQNLMEKWLEAFKGNLLDELNPLNKLPVVSDVFEGVVYSTSVILNKLFDTDIHANVPKLPITQIAEQAYKAFDILSDRIFEEDTNYTWYAGIFKLLQAASGMIGLPLAAATREIVSGWNNTIGAMAPSLKVKSYEASGNLQIKYAYQDGYLTEAEAIQELIEQGVAKDEDEAYFTIQSWEGRNKYDDVYEAVKSGSSIDEPMQELLDHGYTREEVISQVKTQIGNWYRGTADEPQSITKQQAIEMLSRYTDMSDNEITKLVNEWSCKVVTGIEYDDIKQEYLDGNITAQRAVEMYMRYGGYTKEEAQEKVDAWLCEKETGIAYNNLKKEFLDGNVTSEKAMEIYMNYGGYDQKEASEKVTVLEFVKEHPEADGISYAAMQKYTMYCESSGMDVKVYYDCWKYCNSVSREDIPSAMKKKNIADYINSLDITEEQRGRLFYVFYLKGTE